MILEHSYQPEIQQGFIDPKSVMLKPPQVPARYCRNCGARISVVLESYHVWPDGKVTINAFRNGYRIGDNKPCYTGKYHYKRSEFFHSQKCAEAFAETMVDGIDKGTIHPSQGKKWNDITSGKANE